MPSIIEALVSQLAGDAIDQISNQVGVEKSQAERAVGMALPILLGALNRNTNSGAGSEALTQALRRDHDGSILEDLPQALRKQETAADGAAILEHVLGDKRAGFISSVSRATGLEPDQVSQLFALLAPVVLGALGQIQRKQNLDPQGVSNLLEKERSTVQATSSGLVQLLDMDSDGDVSEEVVTLGANLLGGLFGKKGQ